MTSPLLNHSSGLAGCFNPVHPVDSVRMQAALTTALSEPATLGGESAFCAAAGGGVLEDNGLLLAIAGRVRYAGDAEEPDAILRALAPDYRTLGASALGKLSGRFTLAINRLTPGPSGSPCQVTTKWTTPAPLCAISTRRPTNTM